MKKLLNLTLIFLALGGALSFFIFIYVPGQAKSHIQDRLNKAGFTEIELPNPAPVFNGLIYENVPLDPEDLSSISKLKIKYDWLGSLQAKPIERIEIIGLNLTGDLLEDPEWNLGFSGYTPILSHYKDWSFKTLVVKDASIALLTDTLGGLTFDLDLQLLQQEDHYALQGLIKTSQHLMTFEGPLNGVVREDGWNIKMDLERGKIDIPAYGFKATRLHGTADLTNTNGDFEYTSNLQSGGLVLHGFPWQNAAATFHGNLESARLILSAKSIGIEGLEINLDQILKPSEGVFAAQIFADNQQSLTNYMQKKLITPILDKYNISENFTIKFQGRWNKEGLSNTKLVSILTNNGAEQSENQISAEDSQRLNEILRQLIQSPK